MLALGASLRLLQGFHGVAGVACRLPQLPQPPSQLDHAGVQRVQTDVQLVQACVQAGQAAHCGQTGSTLDGTGEAELADQRAWGAARASGGRVAVGGTRDFWKVGALGRARAGTRSSQGREGWGAGRWAIERSAAVKGRFVF